MSLDAYRDSSMLELFQMEAKTQTEVLNTGLLALERDPTAAQHLEACMRAAHSLKGAARIVNLTPAVPVAHVMEDCLVLAQEGRLRLTSAHIDALLAGADLLLRIAQPPAAGADPAALDAVIEGYVATLTELCGTTAPTSAASPAASSAATEIRYVEPTPLSDGTSRAPHCTQPSDQPFELSSAELLASTGRTSEHDSPAVPTSRTIDPTVTGSSRESMTIPSTESNNDRILRVTATTLNRLLGLSSEAMVETRWLAPYAKSLLHTKRQHDATVAGLDLIHARMQEQAADSTLLGLLDEMRTRAAGTQHALAQRVNELDGFDWRITHLNQRLYDTALACRMRPLADGVTGLARMVRDLGRELGKVVRLDIVGETTKVDRDVLEKLDAPLSHLLRNAVDHGIETPALRRAAAKSEEGVVTLNARHSAGTLIIEITDDGCGVDIEALRREVVERGLTVESTAARLSEAELLEFLFLPGFSTRSQVTEISGRGVGLDAVQNAVRALHGEARIVQTKGQGTRFTLELPLSLSVVRALLVEVAGEPYALPLAFVTHTFTLARADVQQLEGHQHFTFQGRQIGLVSARQLLASSVAPDHDSDLLNVVVLGEDDEAFGVAVDRYLGERSLVVQPLDPRLGKVQDVACGALMEDGSPVLVLDVEDLLRSIEKLVAAGRLARLGHGTKAGVGVARKRVLVVDDSLTVRELERKLLTKRGYDVAVAVDGMDGWNMLRAEAFDMVISDIDMPRMDGIELVTLLKRDPRLAATPVMIVSYKDRPEDRQRGLDAGADYYLAKSNFHDEALLSIVEDLIGSPEA